ncbi:MAG: hypothetical protein QM501_14525, partial [Gimesia sp.]
MLAKPWSVTRLRNQIVLIFFVSLSLYGSCFLPPSGCVKCQLLKCHFVHSISTFYQMGVPGHVGFD